MLMHLAKAGSEKDEKHPQKNPLGREDARVTASAIPGMYYEKVYSK